MSAYREQLAALQTKHARQTQQMAAASEQLARQNAELVASMHAAAEREAVSGSGKKGAAAGADSHVRFIFSQNRAKLLVFHRCLTLVCDVLQWQDRIAQLEAERVTLEKIIEYVLELCGGFGELVCNSSFFFSCS